MAGSLQLFSFSGSMSGKLPEDRCNCTCQLKQCQWRSRGNSGRRSESETRSRLRSGQSPLQGASPSLSLATFCLRVHCVCNNQERYSSKTPRPSSALLVSFGSQVGLSRPINPFPLGGLFGSCREFHSTKKRSVQHIDTLPLSIRKSKAWLRVAYAPRVISHAVWKQ